ncbi:MAG: MmgE/PrpD family protein [Alphaproteobacteria bacterium]|nr:MmgE/PrpD family protein [Alphaproteobacteria bacterium]
MSIVNILARSVNELSYDDISDEALYWAKLGVLDTIGVTLAGVPEPCTQKIARIVAAEGGGILDDGPSLLFGFGRRTSASNAALVNGVGAHALDFDDCNNTLGGHPSAPILPGLLALVDARGATGRDVILAYLAGFEVETALGRVLNTHHYAKGWHPTATLGVFGAGAAAAKLMGLGEEGVAMALSLCASFASGVKANFGTMTKPLHVGHTARNGVMAALLAEQGFTANDGVFEHPQGFLNVYNGAGNFDESRLLDGWANPFNIVRPGLAIKQHPCCGSTHSSIDTMLALRVEHGLTQDNVAKILTQTHPHRLAHTNRANPKSGLDAKFSVQYVVSRALMHGQIRIEHFENDAHDDPTARAIMDRVTSESHPRAGDLDPPVFSEVTVTLTNGKVVSKMLSEPIGRSPDSPYPPGAVRAKFMNCAQRALPMDVVEQLASQIESLEDVEDVRTVINLMDTPTAIAERVA